MAKSTFFILLVSLVILSCKKEQFQSCEKNCVDIKVRGQVKNMESNKGLSNIPVSISWASAPFCLTCNSTGIIAKTKTDGLGNYGVAISVDSSLFVNSYIKVSIPTDNKHFLYYPDPSGNDFTSLDIDSVRISDINFEAYPKAILIFNVKHPKNSKLQAGQIFHSYSRQFSMEDYFWFDKKPVKDTLIKTVTGAGIFTKITYRKIENDKYIDTKDSLKCESGRENVYEISF